MKVSINWLKDLVNYKESTKELEKLLSLHCIATKEITSDYFELDMKGYNRADLLSMRGVAYEVAAITNSKVSFQEDSDFIWDKLQLPEAKVKVENPDLAPLYCIAKIEGLKVSASPSGWVSKLSDCGVRSINNVADITNLIMLEYGQPMHAFDASQIKDGALIVRCAKTNEEITTLDAKTRKLSNSDLLITDSEKAVGIAGVMGGKNSEVTEKTTSILLEAAIFDPGNLRKTTQKLNLPSEASKRFQHGLTKKRTLQALNAAIRMYQNLGGKLTAISIIDNVKDKQRVIKLNKQNLDSLIGINIPATEVEKYLTQLNFKLASQVFDSEVTQTRGGPALQGWEVIPPYYRLDIEIEADVIEEVARMYGYDKIKAQPLNNNLPEKIDQTHFKKIYDWKVALVKSGLTEVQTYSFFSTNVLTNCDITTSDLIKLANPISAETEYMRSQLWPNLVEVTAKNIKQGIKQVAVFEIGKIYKPQEGKLPEEVYKLALALSDNNDNTIQNLYTIFQTSCSHMKCGKITLKKDGMAEREKRIFHPVRFAHLEANGNEIGYIAEVHPRIVNKFGVENRVAILEISLSKTF